MESKVSLNTIYKPSEDVVARDVQGEFIIIPITSGVGDLEGAIFSLNTTGRAVWDSLDGKRPLKEIVKKLESEFEAGPEEIKKDVLGITDELFKRRMIVEK